MNWKPNDTDTVDYLFGELEPEINKQFETYMQGNPDFAKEVQDLRLTQQLLPSLVDEEVIPPMPIVAIKRAKAGYISQHKWLYPLSIAASIAALLVVGYLTQFNISFGEGGFMMAFNNNVPVVDENTLTREEIQNLIDTRVSLTTNKINSQLDEMQINFAAQLKQNNRLTKAEILRVANKQPKIEDEQILAFISQLKDENRKMMQTFYQVSADEQQKYMRNILLDFEDYLARQRQEDLQFIQANMLDLKSTSELKQEETDKILASIITTVNYQNSAGE